MNMIEIDVPGFRMIRLHTLVLDYNGTMAFDGLMIPQARDRLMRLSADLAIHVVTADTFGLVTAQLEGMSFCEVTILPQGDQAKAKLEFVQKLEANRVVAVGNGRNDARMLKEAGLGIAVLQKEGAASETLGAADIVCPDIESALDLLLNPLRVKATLRS